MLLKFKAIHPDFKLPAYASRGAAAFDLHAPFAGRADSDAVTEMPLGFAVQIPQNHALLLSTRSGHGRRYGACVAQGFGLIDSDYRGEVVLLMTTKTSFSWEAGDRIAQATLVATPRAFLALCDELGETERGTGGFGSTGL